MVVRVGLADVEPERRSNTQRFSGGHRRPPRDQIPLSWLGTRHGGPRHRVVPRKLKPQNVALPERDPPTALQRDLVESQLAGMEVRLTNQCVVTASISRRDDVTVMTQVMTRRVVMTTSHAAPNLQ